ncbi:MAG: RagB/SusD family nutrient uptake outer membrane protein [Flammeovirgaceae bacterium]
MRFFKYIKVATIALGLAVTTLSSCGDELELTPYQSVSPEEGIKNASDLQVLLVGAYEAMTSSNVYGARILMNAELYGLSDDEIVWQGTFPDPRQFYNKFLLTTNSDVANMWIACYRVINITNLIIENLGVINTENNPSALATKNRIEGEARAIRAAMHFELLRFYGKTFIEGAANNDADGGIPIVTKSGDESKVKRNTVAEVYQFIEEELVKAESLLPNAATNGIYFDKAVAAAYLSRVYLQQYKWASARDAANRVIASGKYSLVGDYSDAFNNAEKSTEDIFVMKSTEGDNINSMYTFFSVNSRNDIYYVGGILDMFEGGDTRLDMFDGDGNIYKWNEPLNGNVNVIRLAEMYLTRAEANQVLGTSVGATPLEDINTIRRRVGLPDLSSVTLEDIRKERKLELIAEGHAIHDLKRWKRSVVGIGSDGNPITYQYNSPALTAPIPQREINVNPNLVQNEGYN